MKATNSAALRAPALRWALLHVPVFLALYVSSITRALSGVPGAYKLGLALAYLIEAAFLAWLAWLIALPFSLRGRLYRFAAPAATSLFTAALVIDSRLYEAVEFHVNGFFFRVLVQPGALRELGIDTWQVAVLGAVALGWLAAELWGGSRFLDRFASGRRTIGWAALLLALALVERVSVATMSFFGGPAMFAAGQVLPLIPPLRMNSTLSRLTGRPRMADPFGGKGASLSLVRVPEGVAPDSVRFARTPDIVFALLESVRSDFLDPGTMPRLLGRAGGGALFERHYATASSTHYSLFSLFFGLQSQKLEAVVGAGRSPLLFGALKANGYRMRLLAASSVDWMGLRRTVFGDVRDDLESSFQGERDMRDAAMLASARHFVEHADDRPLFLFLFFDGTHFNYSFPERSARFRPYWNGGGSLAAAGVAPVQLEARARNAAYEVDWKLDEFLTWLEARRGRRPLVIVTGDHGEEFRERGHVGHGSDVNEQQIHVPMVLLDSALVPSRHSEVTSHVDVMPTLFTLLGDTNAPSSYSDGLSMLAAPPNRFVLASVGWEPRFAVIGSDLKIAFNGLDAGLGKVLVTDPCDRPLADGQARFSAEAVNILRAFRSEPPTPPAGAVAAAPRCS
ncbi:MAG: sulfatase-like hydrolase/transferase [Gemmatimonadetes bacterium]|nr:sulfatase-like hydrolase/transferase [Gemmatimonadota bacterium]